MAETLNTAVFYAQKDNVAEQIAGTGLNGIEARYRAVKVLNERL